MNAENQLLQPTGQATPETKNDQVAPGLNITQPGDQLQYTDQSLFIGASNREIVVLKQSSAVAAATTTVKDNSPQQKDYSSSIIFLGIVLLVIVGFLVVSKIKSKKQVSNIDNG